MPSNRDNYDLYTNFLCIFACIYALAKVTDMAEHYLSRAMYEKLYISTAVELPRLKQICSNNQNLLLKIAKLEEQNLEMKFREKIKSLSQINPKSIYISSNYFRVDQGVSFNNDVDIHKNQPFVRNDSDANDIWMKYLEMQNKSLGRTASAWTCTQNETFSPVVISSKDLQNINDIWMHCHNNNIKFDQNK